MEHLREKLESIVSSVESVVQDAQGAQDEIKSEHDREIFAWKQRYARLEEENHQVLLLSFLISTIVCVIVYFVCDAVNL